MLLPVRRNLLLTIGPGWRAGRAGGVVGDDDLAVGRTTP
jgi:hypothetical protein